MITEAILTVLIGVASGILGLLPDADMLDLEGFSGIWHGYSFLNGFLPLSELLACLAAFIGFHVVLYSALGVVYVWRLLPFKFT